MSLIARASGWWRERAPRERAMLATMAALVGAFVWWYGLLAPLEALREAAARHHARAVASLQRVEAEVATLAASHGAQVPEGDARWQRIQDGLRDAGLAPDRQRTAADGRLVFEFERVDPPTLFASLGGLATADGIAPASLRVERADGRVRAEVGVDPGATP